jgi:acylphosphatase
MKKSVRIYISGAIQAIFYKAFIKENAERYNVKGFIRSLDDGRIEIFLEGNPEEVNKLTEFAKKGPRHTNVKNFEIKPEKFQGIKTFKVLHI